MPVLAVLAVLACRGRRALTFWLSGPQIRAIRQDRQPINLRPAGTGGKKEMKYAIIRPIMHNQYVYLLVRGVQ